MCNEIRFKAGKIESGTTNKCEEITFAFRLPLDPVIYCAVS